LTEFLKPNYLLRVTDFSIQYSLHDFTKQRTVQWPIENEPFVSIKPPLNEVQIINFEFYLYEYYFNNEVIFKTFIEIMDLYLEARPSLKEAVIKKFNEDKVLNKSIPENIVVYFICYYLTTDLTHYMKSFIVANLDLNDKNPLYTLRDCLVKK